MSDELTISGGGRITVTTESMRAVVDELMQLSHSLDELGRRASSLGSQVEGAGLFGRPDREQHAADLACFAARVLDQAGDRARQLSTSVSHSIEAYSWAERTIAISVDRWLSGLAYSLGVVSTASVLMNAPALIAASLAGRVAQGFADTPRVTALRGRDEHTAQAPAAADEPDPWNGPFSHPLVVESVRHLSDNIDDFMRGTLLVPPGLSAALDDDATGLFGREEAATALFTGAAALGVMREGAVRVHSAGRGTATAPQTIDEMVGRIPHGAAEAAPVRVERYPDGRGGATAVVYLGGTRGVDGQPWDNTSNLAAMGHVEAGSERATRDAMTAAGVGASDSVVFVGYSQGGLLASRLAESGDWATAGLVTVGSPGGAIATPEGVPVLALAHDEDLISALSGTAAETATREPVTVRRSLFDGAGAPEGAAVLAGHDFGAYLETARLAQASDDEVLASERTALLEVTSGLGAGELTAWRAERVSGDDRPAVAAPAR